MALRAADKTVKSDKVFPFFDVMIELGSVTTCQTATRFILIESKFNGSFHDFKVTLHEEENFLLAHDQLAQTQS